jgi:hypothetical protein
MRYFYKQVTPKRGLGTHRKSVQSGIESPPVWQFFYIPPEIRVRCSVLGHSKAGLAERRRDSQRLRLF